MKELNENKICFIICTNNDAFVNECILYLNRLQVPEGMETDLLTVTEARSMLSGYKEACEATDALYKVFLHQDVFILNTGFISDIKAIFDKDENIGLIGMVGSPKMPKDYIMWSSKRVGNCFLNGDKTDYSGYRYDVKKDGYDIVEAVDGLLMAAKGDVIPLLRDDLFDGWDMYDVSLSQEMIRAGKKVAVPRQTMPWCLHDDGGLLSMFNYNKYRKIAIEAYAK